MTYSWSPELTHSHPYAMVKGKLLTAPSSCTVQHPFSVLWLSPLPSCLCVQQGTTNGYSKGAWTKEQDGTRHGCGSFSLVPVTHTSSHFHVHEISLPHGKCEPRPGRTSLLYTAFPIFEVIYVGLQNRSLHVYHAVKHSYLHCRVHVCPLGLFGACKVRQQVKSSSNG